ncbi:MAG: toll/interleukin-1 receptor domain-containing protein [Anaerolineales bacterium]
MTDEVFISYSRRDLEFVSRLAADLDANVTGVWFDKSDIRAGQKWRDEILNGIARCKVVVLVLSPDSAASQYVQMEVRAALDSGKTIIPILYRPVQLTGWLGELVSDTQYIDLRQGSYADNFQVLVDGLLAAGAVRQSLREAPRPFLLQPAKTNWGAVITKIPGWGCAWSLGWGIFWLLLILFLILVENITGVVSDGGHPLAALITVTVSGAVGGFTGGLLAGLFSMAALRRYAPSIAWKHVTPSVRIWALSGVLGLILSGVLTSLLLGMGMLAIQANPVDCGGLSVGECVGAGLGSAIGTAIGTIIAIALVFLLLLGVTWFAAGLFAGWLAVRHIRTLEPGIRPGETRWVMLGWGLGAVLATITTLGVIAAFSAALGL